jgi:hypothetical protein
MWLWVCLNLHHPFSVFFGHPFPKTPWNQWITPRSAAQSPPETRSFPRGSPRFLKPQSLRTGHSNKSQVKSINYMLMTNTSPWKIPKIHKWRFSSLGKSSISIRAIEKPWRTVNVITRPGRFRWKIPWNPDDISSTRDPSHRIPSISELPRVLSTLAAPRNSKRFDVNLPRRTMRNVHRKVTIVWDMRWDMLDIYIYK